MRHLIAAALLLSVVGAACGGSSTAPTPVTPAQTAAAPSITETFAGTLAVGGSRFYSFTVGQYGTVTVTLTRLTGAFDPATTTVVLGFGRPAGTGCSVANTTVASPGDTPQTSNTLEAGVYCVRISDAGVLTAPAAFSIDIARP
jgi:hypothetical protein